MKPGNFSNDKDVAQDLQTRSIGKGSKAEAIRAGKIKYKGFEGLNLDYCRDIVTDGPLTHLTPAHDYTYEEMDAILLYSTISAIIGSLQESMMLQMQIQNIKNDIENLVVPSNVAMTVAKEIPYFDSYPAFELVISLGDVTRFASLKDAQSYLGIVPIQSSTGHKNCKGRRLSPKGRKNCKSALFRAVLAVAMRNNFKASQPKCSVLKLLSHGVSVYLTMIKHQLHYIPLKTDVKGRNEAKVLMFSKVKNINTDYLSVSETKSHEVMKQGITALFSTLCKLTKIKKAHNTCQDEFLLIDDIENETAIMPTYQNHYKQPKVDSRYERHLIKERISNALFNDYNSFYAAIDSISGNKGSLMGWFGNNYFAFLDLMANDISAHSFAFANTIKNATAQEIIGIVQRKINEFGLKAKNTLNSIKKADQYQAAAEMTLQGL